jgi:hypothetical protein
MLMQRIGQRHLFSARYFAKTLKKALDIETAAKYTH